jgi:hypothetical protein
MGLFGEFVYCVRIVVVWVPHALERRNFTVRRGEEHSPSDRLVPGLLGKVKKGEEAGMG